MPVIRFGGTGLSNNKTSQQVSAPATNQNESVSFDNVLQLDQKVRTILGISQNICDDGSKINYYGKNYLLTNNLFLIDTITAGTDTTTFILQGSNYSIVSPKNNTILINNSPAFTVLENIEFYSDKKEPIIKIQNNSKVLFKNCVFKKSANTQTSTNSFIEMDVGCKASFVGCLFTGEQTAGTVINNAGIANDATINGGFNTTTRNHSNTTIFGELT